MPAKPRKRTTEQPAEPARVVLLLSTDPAVVGRRLLLPARMTLHSDPSSRALAIEDGRLKWEPDLIPLSANDLQILIADTDETSDPRRQAKVWLIDLVEDNRLPAEEVLRLAKEQRIPWRILQAAKKDAKVTSVRDGKEQRWYWKLPDNWIRDFEGVAFPVVL